ncbi:hypothetical protein [Tumebacillus lipolyticus]|uniref:Lipoprotein n=1 Tax=Tumebacillus lipolyticus TaxID=1280370 RepID=A0ABW5A006_9BACL
MRRWITAGIVCGLMLSGCAPQTAEPQKPAHQEKSESKLQFEDLLQTSKLVMTTKAGSDLPKTWKFEGEEAKAKANSLVAVLKQGKELTPEEGRLVKNTVPIVSFILDVSAEKASISVYEDRFEFQSRWYELTDAPDLTYGAINEIKK